MPTCTRLSLATIHPRHFCLDVSIAESNHSFTLLLSRCILVIAVCSRLPLSSYCSNFSSSRCHVSHIHCHRLPCYDQNHLFHIASILSVTISCQRPNLFFITYSFYSSPPSFYSSPPSFVKARMSARRDFRTPIGIFISARSSLFSRKRAWPPTRLASNVAV